jgi:hypothetical protein
MHGAVRAWARSAKNVWASATITAWTPSQHHGIMAWWPAQPEGSSILRRTSTNFVRLPDASCTGTHDTQVGGMPRWLIVALSSCGHGRQRR